MVELIVHIVVTALLLMVVAQIVPGISVRGFGSALIGDEYTGPGAAVEGWRRMPHWRYAVRVGSAPNGQLTALPGAMSESVVRMMT